MRYRLVVLMLLMPLVVLPVMHLFAAPAPDPSAILDIGPPPKDWSQEKYCRWEIDVLKSEGNFCMAYNIDAELRKLEADSRRKNFGSWMKRNTRIVEEDGGRSLRVTFRAGTRAEQATIINALLRANLKSTEDHIKQFESTIRSYKESIAKLEKEIEWFKQDHDRVDSNRSGINELRSTRIPAFRAEIARLKQYTVIKWAK